MYFQYKKENEPIVSIIYSPFHEMICSLHVLANPAHHIPRLKWSEEILDSMSEEDKSKLSFYNNASNEFIGMLAFIKKEFTWYFDIKDMLDYITAMDLEEFYYNFFNEKFTHKEIKMYLMGILPNNMDEELKTIFRKPQFYKIHFLEFLESYYQNFFQRDISFASPLYTRHIKHQYNIAKSMDIYEYLNGLHPRIENTDDKINFHKYKLFEVYKKNLKQIQINVTSFIMPHLLIGLGKDYITLVTPAYITSYNAIETPDDTLKIFKSISDETRMQIIKLLYNGPKSTQKLADLLSLTEACISKHLRILYEAEIVTKERDGNYMNYHLNINVIDRLVLIMYEYISK